MKCLFFILPFTLLLVTSTTTFSQVITSIAPGSSLAGKPLDVVIRASGTHFKNQVTTADFGPDILLKNFKVLNAETGIASIDISAGANIGFRNITVTTEVETVVLPNAFEILSPTGSFSASLEVLPIESIALNNFDVTNLNSLPIFFFVNIYNNNVSRKISVNLYFSSAKRGLLGRTFVTNLSVDPNQYLKLSQRDFTQFQRGPNMLLFFIELRGLNAFPPDDYTYRLEIRNDRGQVIGSDEVITTLTNPRYNPELIYPGNNFSQQAPTLYTPYPLFQWYGQNDLFDFKLFKVLPGQTPEEAVRNLHVYKQDDVSGNSLVYPVFAETLINNQTYAWQIRGKYYGAKGIQYLPSEVFWFQYQKNLDNADIGAVKVKIIPQEILLSPRQQFQFTANFFDKDNTPLTGVKYQWQITPSKGTISPTGLFTAGNDNGTVAVLVKAGSVTDFATITVKGAQPPLFFNLQDWNIEKMIRMIFGLDKTGK